MDAFDSKNFSGGKRPFKYPGAELGRISNLRTAGVDHKRMTILGGMLSKPATTEGNTAENMN